MYLLTIRSIFVALTMSYKIESTIFTNYINSINEKRS